MLPVETPFKIYTGLDGKPLDGGFVYFGLPNQNPITAPITVYWDSAGTQPAAQPVRTVNGYIMRAGTPANVYFSSSYSELVCDRKGRQVFYGRTSDDFSIAGAVLTLIASLASSAGSSTIGFIAAFANAIAQTTQAKLRQIVSTFDSMTTAQQTDVSTNANTLDVRAAINTSIAGVAAGGSVYAPAGTNKLLPAAANLACVTIATNNMRLTGTGAGSIFKTSANKDVPVHVSTQPDLGNNTQPSNVRNVTIDNLAIKGTAAYQYFALAYGRGILGRGVERMIVSNCFVEDMSMIGICFEGGAGSQVPAYLVNANICFNNKYSAININGRGMLSIISSNICSGTNGEVNSCAIQATGHTIMPNNTVYGDIVNYAISGGIIWGEGPYHGIGSITGSLVKHCQFGIKSVYHGPVIVSNNVAINNRSTGGIVMVGGTTAGLPVESSDSAVCGNLLVNNYPYEIDISTPRTLVSGNRCVYLAAPVNAGGAGDPDAIQAIRAEAAIHVAVAAVSLIGNYISGQLRGMLIRQDAFLTLGVVAANEITGTTAGAVGIESDIVPALIVATIPLFERRSNGNGNYANSYHSTTKCLEGFWGAGDTWNRYPGGVGLTLGERCVGVVASATPSVIAGAGAVNITLASSAGLSIATGNILGIELDNHQYLWTTITGIAGAVITIAAGIPAGRTAPINTRMYWQQWAPLAAL